MIAAALGVVLITGALRLFIQFRAAWQTAENFAAAEERIAFALTALEQDAQLAGFHRQTAYNLPDGFAVRCAGTDISSWALNMSARVAAHDGSYGLPCPANTSPVSGSDILVLRYADPGMNSGADNDPPVHIRAWYLDQASSTPGEASLHRYTLVRGGLLQDQEIISGVADFQIELGIDRNTDGLTDGFVTAATANGQPILAIRFRLTVNSAYREPGAAAPRSATAERTVLLRNPPADG